MNQIFLINAYRQGKTWMFDDKQRGIKGEPFVAGASELIQKFLDKKGIKARKNVPLIFSLEPFPDSETILYCTDKCFPLKQNGTVKIKNKVFPKWEEDLTAEPNSAYYISNEGDVCWLCPAQIKFFGGVADTIYAKIG